MASIVEALVVTLGLDARQFDKGRRDVEDSLKRTREAADGSARSIEASGKRAAGYLRSVRNEVVGLFLAFAGGNSLKNFAAGILEGDAATGRLATNLGIATTELSAWEGAIRRVGGSAKDADNALSAMVGAFQSYQLTGSTGHDADFQGLGVSLNDLRNPAGALLQIASASERMSRPEFVARLQRIGLPESTITMLARGRRGVEQLVDEQYKLGVVNDHDAAAAQRLQDKWAQLQTAITGKVRPALTGIVDGLLDMTNNADAATQVIPVLTGLVGALGIAATIAYGPWVALAGAIALVIRLRNKSQEQKDHDWQLSRDFYGKLKEHDLGGAWDIMKQSARETLGFAPSPDNPSAKPGAFVGPGSTGGGRVGWLMANGYTAEQARGIVAGVHAESGWNPNARNPTSGAFGIGQWLGPRQRELFRRYGPNPNLEQQMQYLLWELKGGDRGGPRVGQQATADNALLSYVYDFMRPGRGTESIGDVARGRAYLNGGRGMTTNPAAGPTSQSTTVGTINIYTPDGQPDTIAKGIRQSLAQRGLVVQADTGLTP